MGSVNFEILVDDSMVNLIEEASEKQFLLGKTNDFEDGEWNYKRFEKYIFNKIYLTALSAREREALIQTNETYSILEESCKNIRLIDASSDKSKGSEIAEILLYGIMSDYFKALPVVPKIYYKQNNNDFAKGADSVHIVLDVNGQDYTIWYGEAKFYKQLTKNEFNIIATSVQNALLSKKIRKENSVITDIKDLDILLKDDSRKDDILNLLNQNTSIDNIKMKLHIPIMLLYECPILSHTTELTNEIKEALKNEYLGIASQYFDIQDTMCNEVFKYSEVTFHLILFPVKDKAKIVDSFCKKVKTFRS